MSSAFRIPLAALLAVGLVAGCAGGPPADDAADGTTTTAAAPSGGGDFDTSGGPESPEPVAGHPRLLVTEDDLPRLRGWARDDNPLWTDAVAAQLDRARGLMDDGDVPGGDTGTYNYEEFPTELFAELFAFDSLVDPDEDVRADSGRRARDLLMYAIDEAASGDPESDSAFRDPTFPSGDRSRWWGEGFPLTVDWAYPYFSTEDKATIRDVFLRWSGEMYESYPMSELQGPGPTPGGEPDDPALVEELQPVHWSLNNYFIAHARNMGLMALALDEGDDPDGELRGQLQDVMGTWVFMTDHALRTEAAGGLSPEGFEYGPEAIGRLIQLLYAMHTAGQDDQGTFGEQVSLDDNPFYADMLTGLLESLPPGPTTLDDEELSSMGEIWQPAWFGDAQEYWVHDMLPAIGPLALLAREEGDDATVDAVRWLVTDVPPGGRDGLIDRVGDTNELFTTILAFLVLDPDLPPAEDPRDDLPLTYVAPGLNRILARTCWCDDARIFTTMTSWKDIDHQRGDGGDFGFFRDGEWLTKLRTAYGDYYSDLQNTLAIANAQPLTHDEGDERRVIWERGSQYVHDSAGPPTDVVRSVTDSYVYTSADMTGSYNSESEEVDDLQHASRSIVWLEPDHIIVYDRVEMARNDGPISFFLQTPGEATIDGTRSVVQTDSQQLGVTTLLPEGATLSTQAHTDVATEDPARGEPMTHRLEVDAPEGSTSVRFLHVLQGADRDADLDSPVLLTTTGTPFAGAAVAATAVLFPVDLDAAFDSVSVDVPDGVDRVLVTGLEPGADFDVAVSGRTVTVHPGGSTTADDGGVLDISL